MDKSIFDHSPRLLPPGPARNRPLIRTFPNCFSFKHPCQIFEGGTLDGAYRELLSHAASSAKVGVYLYRWIALIDVDDARPREATKPGQLRLGQASADSRRANCCTKALYKWVGWCVHVLIFIQIAEMYEFSDVRFDADRAICLIF